MNADERLASLVQALEASGISCLVMGGHAVRHYGLHRYTNDYDLTLAPEGWDALPNSLAQTGLFPVGTLVEGNSWRPGAFRRFRIGTLANGQEEWLEFWRENHLLAPFPELYSRREVATYGGQPVPFLGLADLIGSKETERSPDWDDVCYLEEVQDARFQAQCNAGLLPLATALSELRSRRGFDSYWIENRFNDAVAVRAALARTHNPITQAFLLPGVPDAALGSAVVAIEPVVEKRLRSTVPASALHRALVEVVRRQYKVYCQARDRADKQAIRALQDNAQT